MARKRYSDEDVLKLLREIDVHLHDHKPRVCAVLVEQVRFGIRRGDLEKPDQPDARILELAVASGRSFRQN